MYRRPTFCVSVGLSFKLILSVYKYYILVHRAIPKSLRLEHQPSVLDFGPQGNTQISCIGLSTMTYIFNKQLLNVTVECVYFTVNVIECVY